MELQPTELSASVPSIQLKKTLNKGQLRTLNKTLLSFMWKSCFLSYQLLHHNTASLYIPICCTYASCMYMYIVF